MLVKKLLYFSVFGTVQKFIYKKYEIDKVVFA